MGHYIIVIYIFLQWKYATKNCLLTQNVLVHRIVGRALFHFAKVPDKGINEVHPLSPQLSTWFVLMLVLINSIFYRSLLI